MRGGPGRIVVAALLLAILAVAVSWWLGSRQATSLGTLESAPDVGFEHSAVPSPLPSATPVPQGATPAPGGDPEAAAVDQSDPSAEPPGDDEPDWAELEQLLGKDGMEQLKAQWAAESQGDLIAVSGQVLDATGAPMPDAGVSVIADWEDDRVPEAWRGTQWTVGELDAEGRFTIALPAGVPMVAFAGHSLLLGSADQRFVPSAEMGPIVLVLRGRPGGRLRIQAANDIVAHLVVYPPTPTPGRRALLRGEPWEYGPLEAGVYHLLAIPHRNALRPIRRSVDVVAGKVTEVALAFEPSPVVHGRVVDHAGAPVRGVRLEAEVRFAPPATWANAPERSSDGRSWGLFERSWNYLHLEQGEAIFRPGAVTDADGLFRIQGVGTGAIRLRAFRDGGVFHDASVRAADTPVIIEMPDVPPQLVVSLPDAPAGSWSLTARGVGGERVYVRGRGPELEVRGLAPGPQSVWVQTAPPKAVGGVLRVTIAPGSTARHHLSAAPTGVLIATALDGESDDAAPDATFELLLGGQVVPGYWSPGYGLTLQGEETVQAWGRHVPAEQPLTIRVSAPGRVSQTVEIAAIEGGGHGRCICRLARVEPRADPVPRGR